MKKRLLLAFLLHGLLLGACSAKDDSRLEVQDRLSQIEYPWLELSTRLHKDGFEKEKLNRLFARMSTPPSLRPMGTKVKELYSLKFMRKPSVQKPPRKPAATKLGIPGPWFEGVVTKANAELCRKFIRANRNAFKRAEKKYGVPPEVGAALLFVETRLGTQTGRENAFFTLASMAHKFPVKNVLGYVDGIPGAEEHEGWIKERMEEKSEWAYRELKALLTYCEANGIDPHSLPGSSYGAIGMCQFMPSNISHYAEDGNGDGRIDLFNASDAILSLSRYLSKYGWHKGMTLKEEVKVLMHYNKMLKYAHTILALAKTIENLEKPAVKQNVKPLKKQTAATKSIKKAKAGKKAALKKSKPAPKKQKRWVTAKGRDITSFVE